MTTADIERWFSYHPPNDRQIAAYQVIRSTRSLALVILENTPASADQSAAIRLLREAVMTANAAIACAEEVTRPD